MMPHDKIRSAARERMAKTGEPYTAARRAVISEHQTVGLFLFPSLKAALGSASFTNAAPAF